MNDIRDDQPQRPSVWAKAMLARVTSATGFPSEDAAHGTMRTRTVGGTALWTQRLFEGKAPRRLVDTDRVAILRHGVPVHELALPELPPEALIGRHPKADLQLEAHAMALFHACLWRLDEEYYIESLDAGQGTLLNRQRLEPRYPVQLRDGAVVDLPGYQLLFTLPGWPAGRGEETGLQTTAVRPESFATPVVPLPPPSRLRSHLIEARERLGLWSEGTHTLKLINIIEETADSRTFCLVGEIPMLFSYQPGQFVTLLLEIDGREVQRSYSMSSAPSRPHTLELTVKRVPGGLVSNWLCDRVKPGDLLRVKGPSGRFSCFRYPADKLLFIAAGSGLTPIMSMCRWIVDTAADVDVKLLGSFRTPSDILFRRELQWMSARHGAFQVALTMTGTRPGAESWIGFTGRISPRMIDLLAPDFRDRHIFLCGPDAFMDSVKAILRQMDFDLCNLHLESFGNGRVARGIQVPSERLTLSGPLHRVTFTKSGLTVDTDEHLSLLDLAEAHGIEIDYSCRSGTCGECEVKCRGEVQFSATCEIDERQRAAGFVYACSCVAKSDLIVDA